MGQTRSLDDVRRTTVLVPRADLIETNSDVAKVPQPAVSNRSKAAQLLDHLVGCHQQRLRHIEAERLGCL